MVLRPFFHIAHFAHLPRTPPNRSDLRLIWVVRRSIALGRVGHDLLAWSRPLPLCQNQRRESRLDGVDIQELTRIFRFRSFVSYKTQQISNRSACPLSLRNGRGVAKPLRHYRAGWWCVRNSHQPLKEPFDLVDVDLVSFTPDYFIPGGGTLV